MVTCTDMVRFSVGRAFHTDRKLPSFSPHRCPPVTRVSVRMLRSRLLGFIRNSPLIALDTSARLLFAARHLGDAQDGCKLLAGSLPGRNNRGYMQVMTTIRRGRPLVSPVLYLPGIDVRSDGLRQKRQRRQAKLPGIRLAANSPSNLKVY